MGMHMIEASLSSNESMGGLALTGDVQGTYINSYLIYNVVINMSLGVCNFKSCHGNHRYHRQARVLACLSNHQPSERLLDLEEVHVWAVRLVKCMK